MNAKGRRHAPPRDVKIIPPFVEFVDQFRTLLGDLATALSQQNGSGYGRSIELSRELVTSLPELRRQIEILGKRIESWSHTSGLKEALLYCAESVGDLRSDLGVLMKIAEKSRKIPDEVNEPLRAILELNSDIEHLGTVVERVTDRG